MNNLDVSDIQDLVFNDPTTGTINQTAGNLLIDDIMAKDRANVMATTGDVTFPVITDVAGEVDAFRLPALAGAPTASPTSGGEGHMVWDSSNNRLYIWDGAAWDDQSTVTSAANLDNLFTAEVSISARDVVYISSADNVSPAVASAGGAPSRAIGFATAAATATNPVEVRSAGQLAGFAGLTAGDRYYLSAATAGAVVNSVPTGAGNTIVQVGYARSASELFIDIQQLGRRS
jgi:hypothetical protein